MAKKISKYLKIIITLFLLTILLININLEEVYIKFLSVNLIYLIIPILFWPISILLCSYKWRFILKHYGINISSKDVLLLYWIGSFFNNFFPSSFGGDGYKLYYLNKKFKNKKGVIIFSMILERGFGFIALLIIMVSAGMLYLNIILSNTFLTFIYITSFIILILFVFFILKKHHIPKNFKNQYITRLYNSLISLREKKIIFISLTFSIFFVIISTVSTWFFFKAVDYNISLILLFFIVPLINFAEFVPFTINSFGAKEGLAIYIFHLFNLNPESALAAYLLIRLLSLILTSTGGIGYILNN